MSCGALAPPALFVRLMPTLTGIDSLYKFAKTPRLHGASNFRDLGGHVGLAGRQVRSGVLFRSDHLAALTPHDTGILQNLGLTRAIDFRGVSERAAQAYELSGMVQVSLPIEPTLVQHVQMLLKDGKLLSTEDICSMMEKTYRDFVTLHATCLRSFFQHLLSAPSPTVFHCTAGKDRTGFAAALLLSALGVERKAIMDDYLLTNDLYVRPVGFGRQIPPHISAVLWGVQPSFLQAAYSAIDTLGGMNTYLNDIIGVGDAERNLLTELYLTK